MRVMVGDEDFVQQALKLGVKLGDVERLARQHQGAQRRQAARDRHRHLDRGRLERLPAFIASGKLPQPGSAGTQDPTKAETVVYTDTTELEAKLGGLTIGGRGHSSEGRFTETENADRHDDPLDLRPLQRHRHRVTTYDEDANGNPSARRATR